MQPTLSIRGRYVDRTFIPDSPLPEGMGAAELIITPDLPQTGGSIAEAFGGATALRDGNDILSQVRADRDAWGVRRFTSMPTSIIRLVEGDSATRTPLISRLVSALGE